MLENYSRWGVLRVFFDSPTERIGLRELGRRSGIAHSALEPHLESLIQDDLVIREEEKQKTRTYPVYTANTESEIYRYYRRLDVLERLKTSGIIGVLEEKFTPDCIVLFGSASRGEDLEDSDIDLFVQAEEKDITLSEYEEEMERSIQLHIKRDIKDYPEELRNNIANGTVVYGYLEVE